MTHRTKEFFKTHFYFPPLGQRIIKTSVAVFLCLVFYRLRGYRGETMPAEAAISAVPIVSLSRISPTKTRSGISRKAPRSAAAKS